MSALISVLQQRGMGGQARGPGRNDVWGRQGLVRPSGPKVHSPAENSPRVTLEQPIVGPVGIRLPIVCVLVRGLPVF
jgi:hypothetical protein